MLVSTIVMAVLTITLLIIGYFKGGAEATPTGWAPRKSILKPGPDLVGKVCEEWNVDEAF